MVSDIKILEPRYDFKGNESDIENHILSNIKDISSYCNWGSITKIKQQNYIRCSQGHIINDIMLWHNNGTGTIIEVKKNIQKTRMTLLNGVSQLLFYGTIVKSKYGAIPRLVLASNEITLDVIAMRDDYNLPVDFLMVDGNRCVYL